MNYVGKINDIAKPEVTANGIPVVSVSVNNQVGEIATCSCTVKPEDVKGLMSPDTVVTVKIAGDTGGGTIFTGYVSGVNMTHMSGSLSAGVDLTHIKGRDLNDTSVTVPGVIPGGNVDVKTILYHKTTAIQGDVKASPHFSFKMSEGSFGKQLTKGMIKWIETNGVSTTNGFDPSDSGEKGKAIAALGAIEDLCGRLDVPSQLDSNIDHFIHGNLARGGSSSSAWDMLSILAGAFDAVLVCKPDGELALCPNYSGIKSQSNTVPSEIIQKFDRSAQMKRSPKECLLIGNIQLEGVQHKLVPNIVGKHVSSMQGLRGTLLLSVPGWANVMTEKTKKAALESLNQLAEANILRYAHKEKTFNLITPPCPGVMPGTSASFQPTSGLKNFDGGRVSVFEEKFDGYCYKIQHLLEYNNFCTVFWFCTALESVYSKPSEHPLFPGGSMLSWS